MTIELDTPTKARMEPKKIKRRDCFQEPGKASIEYCLAPPGSLLLG